MADGQYSEAYLAQSRVQSIVVCNVILIAFAGVGVVVRLYVRWRYLSGIGWDDIFCLIGYVFTFVECLVCVIMTHYGFGRHIQTVTNTNTLTMFLKLDFVTEITYLFALWAIKVSFALFYLRVFPKKIYRVVSWSLIVLVTAEWIEETFVVIFQCSPVSKAWADGGQKPGKCLSLLSFFYISFAIRLLTDIMIFGVPLPELLRLQMPIGKRIGLILMFSLGILVIVTSIIRATYLNNYSIDHTWTLINGLNWSSVEIAVGCFITCVPSFKTLITYCFPGLKRVLGFSSGRSYGPQYEMYGGSSRRTEDWNRAPLHNKMSNTVTTQTDIEASRNTSEERIINNNVPTGIQVTTDVTVDQTETAIDPWQHHE